jgi:hypothetical protein
MLLNQDDDGRPHVGRRMFEGRLSGSVATTLFRSSVGGGEPASADVQSAPVQRTSEDEWPTPAPPQRRVDVALLAERVYERWLDQLRREGERGGDWLGPS